MVFIVFFETVNGKEHSEKVSKKEKKTVRQVLSAEEAPYLTHTRYGILTGEFLKQSE